MVRVRGPVSFANVQRVRTEILAAVAATVPPPRVLICDCEALTDIEITAVEVMTEMAHDLRSQGIEPWIAAMVSDQQAMLERFGTAPELRFYGTVDEAVAALSALDRH